MMCLATWPMAIKNACDTMKPTEGKDSSASSAAAPPAQRQDGGCPTSEMQDQQHQQQSQQLQQEVSAGGSSASASASVSPSATATSSSSVGPLHVPSQSPTSSSVDEMAGGTADDAGSVGSASPTSAKRNGSGGTIGRTSSPLMATDTPERPSSSSRKQREKKTSGSSGRDPQQSNGVSRYSSSATSIGSGGRHTTSSTRLPPRSPVPSNQQHQQERGEENEDPRIPAAELSERLEEASLELVDNLFRFVSACRCDHDGRGGDDTGASSPANKIGRLRNTMKGHRPKKRKMGLTLPASAIGWLSSRMDPQTGDEDANYRGRITRGSSRHRSRNNALGSGGSGSSHRGGSSGRSGRRQSPSDSMQLSERLALLRFHLPQYVEHLRITNEEWPPPPSEGEHDGRRSSSGSPSLGSNRHAGHQNGRTSALNRLSSPRKKGVATPGTPSTQSPGKRNVLAGYCVSARATLCRVEAQGVDGDTQPSGPVEQILLSQYSQFPQKQAAMRFLLYWQRLQNHPRVDLALFANVRSLILDGVLPEWIANMGVIRNGLEVFRVEHACVYDMASFLLPAYNGRVDTASHAGGTSCVATAAGEGPSEWDEHSPSVLTRAKESTSSHVTNLDLHRFDSLDTTNGTSAPRSESKSAIDKYTSLTRLKLSHCAIGERYVSDESGVLVEPFSRMPKLESLSLSHNEIVRATTACAGLKGLPQLRALDLSFNRIQSMSNAFVMLGNIRTLVLSWNQLSTVDGLERMYSLERLAIDHNNIQYLQDAAGLANLPELMHLEMKGNPIEANDSRFRVNLLNLFKERRLKLLPKGATYRQLQELLPILDGKIVTPTELVGLKEMTFAPLVSSPAPVTDQSTVLVGDTEGSNTKNDVSGPPMTHADFALLGPKNGPRSRSSLTSAASPRKVRRRVQTRKANIRCSLLLSQNEPPGQSRPVRPINNDKKKSAKPLRKHRPNDFSIEDIISALVPRPNTPDDVMSDKEEDSFVDAESSIDDEYDESSSSGTSEADEDSFISATSHADEAGSEVAKKTDEPTTSPAADAQKDSVNDGRSPITIEQGPDGQTSSIDKTETINNIPFPDLLGEADEPASKVERKNEKASAVSSHGANDKRGDGDQVKDIIRPFDFGFAEKNSVYDGKESYSKLSVRSYLQLYFQTFVFPTTLTKGSSFYAEDEMQDGLGEQNAYFPRIQLFHSDRELAMRSPEAGPTPSGPGAAVKPSREKFIDIWTDEIMACGLAATSRLPPVSESLRGFHGEVIRNRGVDELSSESQEILLCLTDAALYFIPDFADANNKDERRFPSSLPLNATFGEALWPHALARHPLEYLQRITIGFQFQRLVLHFVLPKRDGQTQGYEYAYVAFTCNKLRTISLVQKLQAQKKALAEQRADGGAFDVKGKDQVEELIIDNDDRVVLDSLADAIAPVPMGVVLHYQVLRQKWRSKRPDGTDPVVRRVCVVTDGNIFLLDEHYIGDGSTTTLTQSGKYGDATLHLVDSADLAQVTEIRPADEDPTNITLVIQKSRLVRSHRWRLVCKDGESAERLVHDARAAVYLLR